jgi:hypothetical protein
MRPETPSDMSARASNLASAPSKARTAASLSGPTTGELILTIAALRGIPPSDVDRLNDPLWSYLQGFSTIYVDAARVRYLTGHYTSGLGVEDAVEEIMANLEEEAFGGVL